MRIGKMTAYQGNVRQIGQNIGRAIAERRLYCVILGPGMPRGQAADGFGQFNAELLGFHPILVREIMALLGLKEPVSRGAYFDFEAYEAAVLHDRSPVRKLQLDLGGFEHIEPRVEGLRRFVAVWWKKSVKAVGRAAEASAKEVPVLVVVVPV